MYASNHVIGKLSAGGPPPGLHRHSTPALLLQVILKSRTAELDAVGLLVKLSLTILLPLAVGKVAQAAVPGIAPRVKCHKTLLSLVSTASLILIVWQTISGSQVRRNGWTSTSSLCLICALQLERHAHVSLIECIPGRARLTRHVCARAPCASFECMRVRNTCLQVLAMRKTRTARVDALHNVLASF